jgi:hypothetical protein
MNKDSWIALIVASIITIIVATPLYYSRDYARGPSGKLSEGSDTKMTEPIKGTEGTTEPTIMTESIKGTEGTTEPTMPKLDVNE